MTLPSSVLDLIASLPEETNAVTISRSTPLEGRSFWKVKGELWKGCASEEEPETEKVLTTQEI